MYSFVCPDCRAGEHEKCPNGTWCDCLHRSRKDSHSYGRKYMLKRIGVGVALVAATALTLLAAPAAAQAATPATPVVHQECLTPAAETAAMLKNPTLRTIAPCRQVRFEDKCDGTFAVTFVNANHSEHALPAEFFMGAQGWTVEGGDSVTITVPKTAEEVVVQTRYPSPDGPRVDLISHTWERPTGCWDVKAVAQCNGHISFAAKNTSPAPGTILIQPDTTPAVEVVVAGNATFTADYAASTVTWTIDKNDPVTFTWKQPVCTTPTPSTVPTTAPPVGRDTSNDLPATGAQGASTDLRYATISLAVALVAGAGLGVMWFVRRQRRQTSPQS